MSKINISKILGVTVLVGLIALCINAYSQEANKQFIFAQGLYEDGKFHLAVEQFQRFIENFPGNRNVDEAQYLLGMCFWNQKKYKEAINEYSAFISTYSTSKYLPSAYLQRGLAYLEEKKYDKAKDDFVKVGTFLEKPGVKVRAGIPLSIEEETRYKTEKKEETGRPLGKPGRKIVRQVEPLYPEWCQTERIKGEVELKCWILPNGEVRNVEVYRSSGYPRLDEWICQRLMMWRFEPIEEDKIEWGIVSFYFDFTEE